MKNFKDRIYLVVIVVLLASLVAATVYARPQQQPTPNVIDNGRYQIAAPTDNTAYVIDSRTGQTWRRYTHNGDSMWVKQASLPAENPLVPAKP